VGVEVLLRRLKIDGLGNILSAMGDQLGLQGQVLRQVLQQALPLPIRKGRSPILLPTSSLLPNVIHN
jgi:hypothetical protein